MDLAVIGAGRVGTALAVLLSRAGHKVVGVSGRDATPPRAARYLPGVPVLLPAEAARAAEVVILGTPDDAIASVAADLSEQGAFRPGQAVLHPSGALGLVPLDPAARAGATVLCLHPLQTFADVDGAVAHVPGSGMAVTARDETGYALGERLARDAGARPFRVAESSKPLYHAAAVFASNYLVAVAGLAEDLFRAAGLDDPVPLFLPLSRASLDNVEAMGAALALTGPVARGDAGTVARNLEALAQATPGAVGPYVALAGAAADLAERSGRLSPEARRKLEEVLGTWR
jgi:predicted short-subunit dehydrogenase-like oxidoreductase (DUF2520 family)